ncbi:MAG: hypothetical protein ACREET_13165 [Stellaceae bacterium]
MDRDRGRSPKWGIAKAVEAGVMAVMFFAVVTPLGMVMRLAGKDLLRLRLEPEIPSYWVRRGAAGERAFSMNRQR